MSALLACIIAAPRLQGAADIEVINLDPQGVGFNDPTPVAPVGVNTGTTRGRQRLNVYQAVAGYWGSKLDSAVTIRIQATWEALGCNETAATLGSAGAV